MRPNRNRVSFKNLISPALHLNLLSSLSATNDLRAGGFMRLLIGISLFVLVAASMNAQTGPGGVGNSSTNILWLRASDITGVNNGNALSTWNDVSGNADHPTQNGNARPFYYTSSANFNNKPYVSFDGTNDYMDLTGVLTYAASDYTIIAVYKTTSTNKQTIFDAQTGKLEVVHEGNTSDRAFNDGTARGTELTGTGSKLVIWRLDNAGADIFENGTETQSNIACTNRAIGGTTRIGGSIGSGDYFVGEMVELIIYNYAINEAQRVIIENALGNKYGIAVANDQYGHQATHEDDIAGIARLNSTNLHTSAMSAGILMLSNPTGMGDNEGIGFGHDAGSITTWSTSESPNTSIRRLPREWRLDEFGDINTITFTIDTALLPARPSGFGGYVLMLDANGDFSSGATYYPLTSAGGSTYSAAINPTDGDYVAIGVAQYVSAASGTFGTASTWMANSVPPTGSAVYIASGHTVTLGANTNMGSVTVNSGGTLALSSYTLSISGTLTINGSLTMGTGTIVFTSAGAQTIPALTYNNLSLSGAGTKSLAGNTVVNGTLSLSAGTLDVTALNYSLNVKGNWVNSGGTFNAHNGTVTLSGTSNQQVTSGGGSFYNLIIANTATQVSLNDNMNVSNVLTLTDGVLTTGSYRVTLSSSSASAITGYSAASFINGNLRRYFTSNTDTYVFPLGNGTSATNYYRADVVNKNLGGITYFDTKFKALTNHSDVDLTAADVWEGGGLTYTSVNTAGVWELEPNAQPTSGKYDIKLYTANMNGLVDNSFGPLKRPVGSTSAAAWTTGSGRLANDDHPGRRVSDGYMLRTGLGTFSEFGAGSGNNGGAGLPVELVAFTATSDGKTVHINWATATETNNDYFIIEKSANGQQFQTVAIVPGAGNSTVIKRYSIVDAEPFYGTSYYSLTQVDFDGATSVSDIVSVRMEVEEPQLVISPNPFEGKTLVIQFEGISIERAEAEMLLADMNGQEIMHATILLTNSKATVDITELLAVGVYFVQITRNGVSEVKQLVVN